MPCSTLHAIDYGLFNQDLCTSGPLFAGSQCEFHCYDGYVQEGNNAWNCSADSEWDTHEFPTCHG